MTNNDWYLHLLADNRRLRDNAIILKQQIGPGSVSALKTSLAYIKSSDLLKEVGFFYRFVSTDKNYRLTRYLYRKNCIKNLSLVGKNLAKIYQVESYEISLIKF